MAQEVIIERPFAGPPTTPLPIIGEAGVLGHALWDAGRQAHCLRLSLDEYRRERHVIWRRLRGRNDRMAIDFDPDDGPVGVSDLLLILVDYQLEGETPEQTLLRILSHVTELQRWSPQKGKRPELQMPTPKPCSLPSN